MKIVFMGTPKIARDVLAKMVEGGYKPGLVVTQPDREKNRGKKTLPSEVKELSVELGIPVIQPEKIKTNEDFFRELEEFEPDIAVVAAYGKILPSRVLNIPRHGCINVHASLLPKFRGASPIQAAILSGDEKTGVTIMQMDEGMDTGAMLLKGEIPIDGMNAETLSDELGKLGGELVLKTLELIEKGEIKPELQDDSSATYTSMIKKDDGRISLADYSAAEIERMTRAYYPWPGVSIKYNDEPIKLIKVSCKEGENNEQSPGELVKADKDGIYVQTKEGIIIIEELQLPGKNKVDAGAFLRGHIVQKDSFR